MKIDGNVGLERRAALHAALSDPGRLRIVEALRWGDAAPSELADGLAMPANLLAHHLNVLESRGLVTRTRSEGDRRRSYVHLSRAALAELSYEATGATSRVVFVCTANSARSHLAAALWQRASDVPTASAGTHPADRIDPRAISSAQRRHVPLRYIAPRRLDDVLAEGDLLITVCDLAHEELGQLAQLHWSIPDPVCTGTDEAFDYVIDTLTERIADLAPVLTRG
ncbi:MAG TPA: helix-turn-helix domain-containing protein [Jatrophihabitantaceae bacterium]|nr:helix-turn-helix domain-containing protein [Jatrophihabitantaceae bacterium]